MLNNWIAPTRCLFYLKDSISHSRKPFISPLLTFSPSALWASREMAAQSPVCVGAGLNGLGAGLRTCGLRSPGQHNVLSRPRPVTLRPRTLGHTGDTWGDIRGLTPETESSDQWWASWGPAWWPWGRWWPSPGGTQSRPRRRGQWAEQWAGLTLTASLSRTVASSTYVDQSTARSSC